MRRQVVDKHGEIGTRAERADAQIGTRAKFDLAFRGRGGNFNQLLRFQTSAWFRDPEFFITPFMKFSRVCEPSTFKITPLPSVLI